MKREGELKFELACQLWEVRTAEADGSSRCYRILHQPDMLLIDQPGYQVEALNEDGSLETIVGRSGSYEEAVSLATRHADVAGEGRA